MECNDTQALAQVVKAAVAEAIEPEFESLQRFQITVAERLSRLEERVKIGQEAYRIAHQNETALAGVKATAAKTSGGVSILTGLVFYLLNHLPFKL